MIEQLEAHRISQCFVKHDVSVRDRLCGEWPASSSTFGEQIGLQSLHLHRCQRTEVDVADAIDDSSYCDSVAMQGGCSKVRTLPVEPLGEIVAQRDTSCRGRVGFCRTHGNESGVQRGDGLALRHEPLPRDLTAAARCSVDPRVETETPAPAATRHRPNQRICPDRCVPGAGFEPAHTFV